MTCTRAAAPAPLGSVGSAVTPAAISTRCLCPEGLGATAACTAKVCLPLPPTHPVPLAGGGPGFCPPGAPTLISFPGDPGGPALPLRFPRDPTPALVLTPRPQADLWAPSALSPSVQLRAPFQPSDPRCPIPTPPLCPAPPPLAPHQPSPCADLALPAVCDHCVVLLLDDLERAGALLPAIREQLRGVNASSAAWARLHSLDASIAHLQVPPGPAQSPCLPAPGSRALTSLPLPPETAPEPPGPPPRDGAAGGCTGTANPEPRAGHTAAGWPGRPLGTPAPAPEPLPLNRFLPEGTLPRAPASPQPLGTEA